MQREEVRAFKRELGNYRYYQQRVKDLQFMIDLCYHMLSGLHSPVLDSPPVNSPENLDATYRVRDDIERHQRNLDRTKAKLEDIEEVLNNMKDDMREAAVKVYADGKTMKSVCDDYFLTVSGLNYRIDKAIFVSIQYLNKIK